MTNPKLNPIEAFPVEHEGRDLICLRDPYGISERVLYVSPETLYILGMFDGEHTVESIREEIMSKFGQPVDTKDIEKLIEQMDEALFLDSDKYEDYKSSLESGFLESDVRPSSHAGLSYPKDPEELKGWFKRFFNEAEQRVPYVPRSEELRGLISPHIDYSRGGKSYALAYRELDSKHAADTFFIFGTSHYAEVDNPFILTKKDFETPLGTAETDSEIIEQLQEYCTWDAFEGEIAHRTEHSIEFQVALIQYLLNGKKDFKIVPVLCNSFYKLVEAGKSPSEDERISIFINALGNLISSLSDRALIVAGVDMAHVGPKFGDRDEVDDKTLELIKRKDLHSLGYCEQPDPEGFYRSVEYEKDWRKVCGLSSIYALLSALPDTSGRILDYDQALETDTGSVVSFASAAFYANTDD